MKFATDLLSQTLTNVPNSAMHQHVSDIELFVSNQIYLILSRHLCFSSPRLVPVSVSNGHWELVLWLEFSNYRLWHYIASEWRSFTHPRISLFDFYSLLAIQVDTDHWQKRMGFWKLLVGHPHTAKQLLVLCLAVCTLLHNVILCSTFIRFFRICIPLEFSNRLMQSSDREDQWGRFPGAHLWEWVPG